MKLAVHKTAARRISPTQGVLSAFIGFVILAFAPPLPAAEDISAYLDPSGRVVFVNEGEQPAPKSSKKQPKASSGRHLVASTVETSSLASRAPVSQPVSPALSPKDIPVSDESGSSAPSAPSTLTGGSYDDVIEQTAKKHQIDPDLVRAVIKVESNFDPNAVSPAGARGLMQLIPATAARFGVANVFDPRANIDGGVRYLKYLLGMYGGDLKLSLAAYNAGENSVARFGGVPAFRETQDYIRRIGEIYPMRTMVLAAPQEPQIVKFVDDFGVVHFSNTDLP